MTDEEDELTVALEEPAIRRAETPFEERSVTFEERAVGEETEERSSGQFATAQTVFSPAVTERVTLAEAELPVPKASRRPEASNTRTCTPETALSVEEEAVVELVGVVLHRLPLADPVHREELLVGDIRGVGLEGVQVGDVALYEDLQLADVDEAGGVRDDAGEEAVVLLVALELGLAVALAGDDHRIEPQAVAEDRHQGVEPQLPSLVLHGGGDGDVELDVHAAVPLRDVPEAGGHHGGVQHLVRDHLALLVADGPHDDDLASVDVMDDEGVLPHRAGGRRDDILQGALAGEREGRPDVVDRT